MADRNINMHEEQITFEDLTGRQKAAALLVILGSDACAKIFKALNTEEVEQLAAEIAKLPHVDHDTISSIICEFHDMVYSGTGFFRGGLTYATEALSKALGAENTVDTIERIRASTGLRPLDHLLSMPGSIELLREMIQEEHPQTIALILAHIKEQQAAEILPALPQDLQAEVITRIANMTVVSPEVIDQIGHSLRERSVGQERVKAGGAKAAAEILNHVEADIEKQIMDSISDTDPELAERISELMFTYDDIVMITDVGMQRLLQEVDEKDLLMALKASVEAIKVRIFKNMSARRRQMIQEDLESMPAVRLKDVLAAQKRVLAVAKEMIQSGEIEIVRDEKQEVLV